MFIILEACGIVNINNGLPSAKFLQKCTPWGAWGRHSQKLWFFLYSSFFIHRSFIFSTFFLAAFSGVGISEKREKKRGLCSAKHIYIGTNPSIENANSSFSYPIDRKNSVFCRKTKDAVFRLRLQNLSRGIAFARDL